MTPVRDNSPVWERYCQDQTRRSLERLEYRLSRMSIVNILAHQLTRALQISHWDWVYALAVRISNWRVARYGLFRWRRPR